ncbi:hypothetical protein [Nocardioides panaciterrulae]|uniref:DNA-directed RNA polymerase specialized sigma24 family protein n=1 Tax=Nocardioides panaciterrulae TaxID=661492 RepID=A0A7Y9E444_9ACTN|nr:hypothetical protein [Nocardioides panaciterrulae]NYD40819.1 DNA-directed RNA polymerase specialized sigma24 family protein [Nocardioides panaciterrulae]
MRNPEQFDAFYNDARDRLLLQTYAFTGDLTAARGAVRDSFVAAWHHWRKVSRLEDPEAWVRPRAWAHAQRRHTARPWHRDKSLDPGLRATLDALAKLSPLQRRTLLLTHLATISLADLAREVGLPQSEAERELQTATSRFAMHRDVATTAIRPLFEPLRAHAGGARLPRATIIRRAGAARRRTHTLAGVAAAVATMLVAGVLVTDADGVHPTLAREQVSASGPRSAAARAAEKTPDPATLPAGAMLTSEEITADLPPTGPRDRAHDRAHNRAGRRAARPAAAWTEGETSDNTSGDGLVLPCQQERYADPHGTAALVRTFEGPATGGGRAATAFQATEVSATDRAAGRTFDRTLGWYAGCTEPRAQLVSTQRVTGVGDRATLVALRWWRGSGSTLLVGVARTGRVTTTTLTRLPGTGPLALDSGTALLAGAVDDLCGLPDAGACAQHPRHRPAAPVPVGEVPGMLVEVDLPPVTGVTRPWVGTEPRKAVTNVAATRCDRTDFDVPGVTAALTRSFVIPGAHVPDTFGLTETVGSMSTHRARALVQRVRHRMAGCSHQDPGTEVQRLLQSQSRRTDLSVWQVTTEISDKSSVRFLMGIVRDGPHVAQVGFVPDHRMTMRRGDFPTLVRRALDRLPALPAPHQG